jgi:nucleotide-binding universal stress UspA family protein
MRFKRNGAARRNGEGIGRVLVGFDGSKQGKDALRLAELLAEAGGTTPTVAFVYEPESIFDGGELYLPPDEERVHAKRNEQTAQVFAAADSQLGAGQYERIDSWGSPARQLEWLAGTKADVIVLGSTHRGAFGRVSPGSVGERLLHGAPCAVAVAPVGYAGQDDPGIKRIGVGYDGSGESKRALDAAISIATATGAILQLIAAIPVFSQVLPRPGMMPAPDYHQLVRDDLEGLLRTAAGGIDGAVVEWTVDEGEPAEALAARGRDLDLLVVGSRGYGPVRRALLGGVSAKLIRSAPCPVLVTPRGSEETSEGAWRPSELAVSRS